MRHDEGYGCSRSPFGFTFIAPLALGATLNPINSTMLSTALVPIAQSLHVDIADTGWLIAALYLTTAVAQPTMGRLVDLLGPRRIYLASLILVAAAGLCGRLASSLTGLVAVRVLLGVGTSGAYPAAMRIFRERADATGSKPPRVAMGILTLAAVSTTAVGPVIGGVLTSAFGWQSIFTVNVPLALVAALLVLVWTPRDRMPAGALPRLMEDVDLTGIALFALFLLSLMAFLMNLKTRPLWLALAGAVIFGAALVVHSRRRQQPFIDVRMLARNRPLTMTYLRAGAISMIVFSVYYGFAQWLQSAAGLSSAAAGLVTLPMSVVAAGSSLTGVRTKGLRAPFLVSIGAALAGCAGLLLVDSETPVWIVAVAFTFFGVPLGAFSTATQAAVYIQAPAEEIGSAAGLQRTAQYIGAIAAASLLAAIYGQRASDHGLHSLAAVMGAFGAVLFIVTLFDRTIPRAVSTAVAASGGAPALQSKEKTMPLARTRRHLRLGRDRSAKRHCRSAERTSGRRDRQPRRPARARIPRARPTGRSGQRGRSRTRTNRNPAQFHTAGRLDGVRSRTRSPAKRLHCDQAANRRFLRHGARTNPAPARRDPGRSGRSRHQQRRRGDGAQRLRSWL